jgi:hypothetical protein
MKRAIACLLLLAATAAAETRYQQLSRRAEGSSGQVKMLSARCLGGPGATEIVAVAADAQGHVLAVGNAWGPRLELGPSAAVWGPDGYRQAPLLTNEAPPRPDRANPNLAGFAARLTPGLDRVEAVARSGWAGAVFSSARLGPDGALYVAGLARQPFAAWAAGHGSTAAPPAGAKIGGRALFLMKLAAADLSLAWVLTLDRAQVAAADVEGHLGGRLGPRFAFNRADSLVLQAWGRLWTVGLDGRGLKPLTPAADGALLAADPRSGLCYTGGDEPTRTDREPWRRPFLIAWGPDGGVRQQYWRWDPQAAGSDKYRLVADSSVRGAAPLAAGRLLAWGQSAGGDSVFLRQPTDLDAHAPLDQGFIEGLWGAGAGSFGWLLSLDETKVRCDAGTCLASFRPDRDQPNSSRIEAVAPLPDGCLAVVGTSARAFIETPDAWFKTFPQGGAGPYLAIFDRSLGHLRFASLLPGVEGPLSLAVAGRRLWLGGTAIAPAGPDSPAPLLCGPPATAAAGWLLSAEAGPTELNNQ